MLRSRRRAALQAWLERVETVLDEQTSVDGPTRSPGPPKGPARPDLVPALAEVPAMLAEYRLDLGA